MAGLLGMNSPYSPDMQQLLGLDPKEMRRQAIFRGLQQAGVQLMQTGKLGDAFAGLSEGVNEAKDDYMQQQMLGYKMKEAAEDKDWESKKRSRQEGQWQAQDDLLAGVTDPWAKAYPDEYAQAQLKAKFAQAGGAEYGLNPIITQNPQTGEYMLLQPSKDGSPPRVMPMPDGYSYVPPNRSLDIGTGYQTVPTRGTGQVGGVIPKDIAGQQAQEEIGTAAGKATAAAPADMAAAEMALSLLDSIERDPNLDIGVGGSSIFNNIPGTPGRDFQTKVDQATSGAFLSAIQQMRGLGALSNAEGQTATQAVTRMTTSVSKEEFLSALSDYKAIVTAGYQRAASRVSGGAPAAGAMEDPLGLRGQ
jgi:hypothetical protein